MGFSNQERINLNSKVLAAGVKDANEVDQWYESFFANKFVLTGDKVWTDPDVTTLLNNPAANISVAQAAAAGPLASILEDLSDFSNAVRLTAVPGTNSSTYVAYSLFNDFSSSRVENWLQPQLVPQLNGLPSLGYSVRLFEGDPNGGGTEVLTTDGTTGTGANKSVGWVFDYANGMLLLSSDFRGTITDPYIVGFRYIGSTADGYSDGYVSTAAINISYDNSTSMLQAINVQDAIDELDGYIDSLTSNVQAQHFIFTPGNPGPLKSNEFTDWSLAHSAATASIPSTIDIDNTFGVAEVSPGIWDMNDITLRGAISDSLFPVPLLTVLDGATFTNFSYAIGPLNISSVSTAPVFTPTAAAIIRLDGAALESSAAAPFISGTVAGFSLTFDLRDGGSLSGFGGGAAVDITTGSNCVILFGKRTGYTAGGITGAVGSSYFFTIVAASATLAAFPVGPTLGATTLLERSEQVRYDDSLVAPPIVGGGDSDVQTTIDALKTGVAVMSDSDSDTTITLEQPLGVDTDETVFTNNNAETMRINSLGNVSIQNDLDVSGDAFVQGNLIVDGYTVSIDSEIVNIADNHLYLNAGNTVSSETGGLVVNIGPSSAALPVAAPGFIAGVAGISNPTVEISGFAFVTPGQFFQVSDASNEFNNGLFEIVSLAGTTVTIRGIGTTATVEDFVQNQFITDTTVQGNVTPVNISVIRAGAGGVWESGTGNTAPLIFSTLASDAWVLGNNINGTEESIGTRDAFDFVIDTNNLEAIRVSSTDQSVTMQSDLNVLGDGYIDGKLTVTGLIDPTGLVLTEQTSDPAATSAGEGTYWVRDDASTSPAFTSSDGYDYILNEADSIKYDNSISSLTATTVQEAIDELGNSPSDGYITIQDEGVTVIAQTNTINFIGSDVLVSPNGTIANVYIPTPPFVSHWNTSDGSNGDQSVTDNTVRATARISTPNVAEGNPFATNTWAGTNQSATVNTVATFTTPGTTTGFGGDSTISITLLDADGASALESFTTAAITGNGVFASGSGNITVTITSFGADTFKFQANASVLVNTRDILTANGRTGGRYRVRAIHNTDTITDGTGSYTFLQTDVFLDTNPTTPAINGSVAIAETGGSVLTKHLSGVEFYNLNSEFTINVNDIDQLNRNTQGIPNNVFLRGSEYGLPNLDQAPFGAGSGLFTGWSNDNNQDNVNYQRTDWSITTTSYRLASPTANVSSFPDDEWATGTTVNSTDGYVLIDTFGVTSTNTFEGFDDEFRRQDSGFNTGLTTGNWVSTATLAVGEAQIFNGRLYVPNQTTLIRPDDPQDPNADWTNYTPITGGVNPDYSALTVPVDYYRSFVDTANIDRSSFTIVFTGTFAAGDALADLIAGNLEIFIYRIDPGTGAGNAGPPPGNSTPLRIHEPFNFAVYDDGATIAGSGIRLGSSAGNTINSTFGTGTPCEDGIYCQVSILNAGTFIDSMSITFF